MRSSFFLAILVLALALTATHSMAQEPVPNDSCAGYPEGAIMRSGGPELGGANYLMRCTSGIWTETTPNPDTTPDPFTFTDQTGVATSTLITSNSVTITGIDASTPVSVSGDGSPEIRINGGGWATSGNIENGQTLEVRLTSNAANSTMNSATVDVGGVTDQWDVTTEASDPCAGSPSVGTTCSDGSIYAGLSPDGNVAMYTTPADAVSTYRWNNGTSNYTDMSMANCDDDSPGTAATCQTGEANTAFLVGATGEPDYPFAAAEYCDGLSAHGYSDWYLPAQDELNVLYTNKNTGDLNGTFDESGSSPDGVYWASSEDRFSLARAQRFSDGNQYGDSKYVLLAVRCVRR